VLAVVVGVVGGQWCWKWWRIVVEGSTHRGEEERRNGLTCLLCSFLWMIDIINEFWLIWPNCSKHMAEFIKVKTSFCQSQLGAKHSNYQK